ncbi:GAF domain-containing protein [Ponticoccus sp. SC2-23]|uniref:GAF domain-containing protein n=1 Tax=Alexandriicola marinus TaxID=2081710 RepID=UPI000FD9B2A1|nr:GAF domain-containing protein [Alexandriicola marinus]MBM1220808.1 GAF domain-containing protein [Ponticoccus sp. SC6-9]MBM1225378.1 GAF domain-containing protein [Ponticoccus sp. SC6-15]MBM1227561.1 GAF domain-containing protein [Ponticoccus sp. SC6-38]MBM1234801.1 GAF domain-containing protein [Ponticoccus sp. SC6-45]MBM1238063.1 GAF domain-containing protein [Ponticoccus sp. SC6-49]MBM1244304.1 GAF domain-containing protein [Ponticoccus sp. SC2-64]MBM1248325.1 GAF domain-containing pro
MRDLAQAIAGQNQPEAAYTALEALVDDTIGIILFTLMELDPERGVARRTYSNMPDAYPASGEKPMPPGKWSDTVQGRHETFVANSIEEIAEVFGDHELIRSLGCESCLNLPVFAGGRLLGTLNCLNVAGHFTPERVAAAETLKLPGAAVFLLAQSLKKED